MVTFEGFEFGRLYLDVGCMFIQPRLVFFTLSFWLEFWLRFFEMGVYNHIEFLVKNYDYTRTTGYVK
jgi:hypothetical protein